VDPFANIVNIQGGTGLFYELATVWTDEFEAKNKGREWDGEFFEEIDAFVEGKIKEYVQEFE
jgi:hypothetical protein